MAVIKVKIKCSVCGFETEKKENDRDSRGYMEIPDRYCNVCKVLMIQEIDGHNKNPDGELGGKCNNCKHQWGFGKLPKIKEEDFCSDCKNFNHFEIKEKNVKSKS